MGVAVSLLGEVACSEQFLVLWHALVGLLHDPFPGMVSHTQEKKKKTCHLQSGKCSVFLRLLCFCSQTSTLQGWGWGHGDGE